MVKVTYDYTTDFAKNALDVSTWTTFKQKPAWWKDLSPFIGGFKTASEYIENSWSDIFTGEGHRGTPRTVKTCPGIGVLFKQSLPLRFMHDIWIETHADGTYQWRAPLQCVTVSDHSSNQIIGSQIDTDMMTLKFEFPITWQTDKPAQVCFTDPIYYNAQPYTVAPGILANTDKMLNFLNVIVFLPKKDAKYVFYKNEICAMMQFSEPVTKMTRGDHTKMKDKFFINMMASVIKTKAKDRI